jgi:hypothetical protein
MYRIKIEILLSSKNNMNYISIVLSIDNNLSYVFLESYPGNGTCRKSPLSIESLTSPPLGNMKVTDLVEVQLVALFVAGDLMDGAQLPASAETCETLYLRH